MVKTIQFVNNDGTKLDVEVTETAAPGGTGRVSRVDKVQELTQKAFEHALEKLRPIAQSVSEKLIELNNPNEITIEFGIKLSAETGVIIASAEAEANFTITLNWKNK